MQKREYKLPITSTSTGKKECHWWILEFFKSIVGSSNNWQNCFNVYCSLCSSLSVVVWLPRCQQVFVILKWVQMDKTTRRLLSTLFLCRTFSESDLSFCRLKPSVRYVRWFRQYHRITGPLPCHILFHRTNNPRTSYADNVRLSSTLCMKRIM